LVVSVLLFSPPHEARRTRAVAVATTRVVVITKKLREGYVYPTSPEPYKRL